MKRRLVLKKLMAAELEIREGGRHTLVFRDGRFVSAVPRHREIDDGLVREIEKQTGVKLK